MVSYRVTFTLTYYKQLHYKETTILHDRTPNTLEKTYFFRVKYCFHPQTEFLQDSTAWHTESQQYSVTSTKKSKSYNYIKTIIFMTE